LPWYSNLVSRVITCVYVCMCVFVRSAYTGFAEKHWLLTWAHELTIREKLDISVSILYLLSFALSYFFL
jgi:hypothetical protein